MFRSKLYACAAALLLTAALGACSSSRHAANAGNGEWPQPRQTAPTGPSRGAVAPLSFPVVDSLAATYLPWNDLYMPFNLKLSRPLSVSCSGRATMVRDSEILLSLRVLGIEMAQIYFNTDSVWIVDKLHKLYCSVPLEKLSGTAGFTVGDIQSAMLGRAFYPGVGTLNDDSRYTDKMFSLDMRGDTLLLLPRRVPSGTSWHLNVVNPGPRLQGIEVELPGSAAFAVAYDGIDNTPAGAVASQVSVAGNAGKTHLDARVTWNPSKARWNENRSTGWQLPRGYRRIGVAEAIKALGLKQ